MLRFELPAGQFLRGLARVALLAGAALLAGCATQYVDGATREVPLSAFGKVAEPRPVQLLVEFQTKGVSNSRATAFTKEIVTQSVKSTGLFSAVQDVPAAGGGILSVTINNVPLTDDAVARGFLAGLTLGAAGQQVTDGYVCTVSYLAQGRSAPIVKTAKHAIHTTVGASSAPPNSHKAANLEDAVRTMVREVMSVTLSDLSHDPAFK